MLDIGCTVYAVEPNGEMRRAAEASLKSNPKFISIAAPGESTTLRAHIADMIVCATAFHWLDATKVKIEFTRLLKSLGKVALIWNIRRSDADEFSLEYEKFWQSYDFSEKEEVNETTLSSFFTKFESRSFYHSQEFELEGFIGRAFSSSFSPREGTKDAQDFQERLTILFKRFHRDNKIKIHYEAKVYIGSLS